MNANPKSQQSMSTLAIPQATLRSERDLPFVEFFEGVSVQLTHADIKAGIWITRMRARAGVTLQTHKHTGEVFAFTLAGSWKYLEYPEVNTAGSYLYEPPGSIHTLHVLSDNSELTDVWFVIRGANLNLDKEGKIDFVMDASAALDLYLAKCREAGLGTPDVITG